MKKRIIFVAFAALILSGCRITKDVQIEREFVHDTAFVEVVSTQIVHDTIYMQRESENSFVFEPGGGTVNLATGVVTGVTGWNFKDTEILQGMHIETTTADSTAAQSQTASEENITDKSKTDGGSPWWVFLAGLASGAVLTVGCRLVVRYFFHI